MSARNRCENIPQPSPDIQKRRIILPQRVKLPHQRVIRFIQWKNNRQRQCTESRGINCSVTPVLPESTFLSLPVVIFIHVIYANSSPLLTVA